jgi:hypothetical protein
VEYITSRGFRLPETAGEMAVPSWFNLWTRRLWPYHELVPGDVLYWYERPRQRLVWRTRVVDVERFPYASKAAALDRLRAWFGRLDFVEPYRSQAPEEGVCLAYKVHAAERFVVPKPEGFRFPQLGWLRGADGDARRWLGRSPLPDERSGARGGHPEAAAEPVLDDAIGALGGGDTVVLRLRALDERMAEVTPERVRALVAQTLRRDTAIVRALKEAHGYRCQFPGCASVIRTRGGGRYAEVAHVEPVRSGGRSVLGNLLVLCPNHHKEFDLGELDVTRQTPTRLTGRLNGAPFDISLEVAG